MRTFLPQDARCIDIVSAFSLMALAVKAGLVGSIESNLMEVRQAPFWVMIFLLLGLLHLISIYLHPFAETLRAIISGISGLFWIYLFLNSIADHTHTPIQIFLGIGCLYSAIITTLYIKQSWKS